VYSSVSGFFIKRKWLVKTVLSAKYRTRSEVLFSLFLIEFNKYLMMIFSQLQRLRDFKRQRLTAVFLVVLGGLLPGVVSAQGNLLVTPRRVVFENGSRIKELNLANIGKDTAKYIISLMEIRMKEDGNFEQITEPDSGQLVASKNLRIYPRTVSIPPGEAQMVKVQLIRDAELTGGEYRSHIYIRSVPNEKPLGEQDTSQKPTDISVKLTAIFGLSIPAIVRVGENDTKVSIEDPSFVLMEDKNPKLSVTLNRSGMMSSYGDLTVECVSPKGKVTQVGIVKGIAVYTPNKRRRFQMDLDSTQDVDYHNCKLHIVYQTQKDAKTQDFAETELALK
jgi:hypothetical protein